MPQEQFETGAVRDAAVAGAAIGPQPRYDLISPIGLKRLAETYGEGALKYGDVNWRKGMPFTVTANHAIAHVVEYLRGDTSEDHLAHAAWGLFALMHFESTHPELNDIKRDDYGQNDEADEVRVMWDKRYAEHERLKATNEALKAEISQLGACFRVEADGTSATKPHLPSRSEVERGIIPPPPGFKAGAILPHGERPAVLATPEFRGEW